MRYLIFQLLFIPLTCYSSDDILFQCKGPYEFKLKSKGRLSSLEDFISKLVPWRPEIDKKLLIDPNSKDKERIFLKFDFISSSENEDFRRKLELLKRLQSIEHVPKFLDCWRTSNSILFSFKKKGRTLSEVMTGFGDLSLLERIEFMIKLTNSVLNIHKAGVIFQKLNLDAVVTSSNFNSYEFFNINSFQVEGDPLQFAPSPFNSPHIMMSLGKQSIPRSKDDDVYSVGVLLATLAGGEQIFSERSRYLGYLNEFQITALQLRIERYVHSVPESVKNLIISMISRDVERRPTMLQVAISFEQILKDERDAFFRKYEDFADEFLEF